MTKPAIPDLISIPAGSFQIGSSLNDPLANENEKTVHRQIELPEFQISKYPITNAEYALFIAQQTTHDAPTHWQGRIPPDHLLDHPVVNISIISAMSYCGWLTQQEGVEFALPTEMQWEKAARGTEDVRRYVWGDSWKVNYCNTLETGIGQTTAVSHFENTNISPFGIVDLLGNVWEWTRSDYQALPGSLYKSMDYGRTHHVVRGGSWRNDQTLARVSCRGRYLPGKKRPYLGFRIVSISFNESQSIKSGEQETYNREKINDQLVEYFNIQELHKLCFLLDIKYELFPRTLDGLSLELILYCERYGRMTELLTKLRESRPNADWQ